MPPVCRLMDYGRFKYEQTKKEREARKNQKVVELKEVRLTPRTDEHDIVAKVKKIHHFLDGGDKVKVTIRFRGREMAHPQLGRQVLEEVTKQIEGAGVIERPPLMEGRAMFMILAPPGAKGAPAGAPRPQGVAASAPTGPAPVAARPAPAGAPPAARPAPPPQGGPSAEGASPQDRPAPAQSAPRPPSGPPRPPVSNGGPARVPPRPRPSAPTPGA